MELAGKSSFSTLKIPGFERDYVQNFTSRGQEVNFSTATIYNPPLKYFFIFKAKKKILETFGDV